jgi:hypothetical protein
MENTRFGSKKDVRLPYSFENNASKTSAQLYMENDRKHFHNQYAKIGHGVQMNESRNITQNKTNDKYVHKIFRRYCYSKT